MKKEQVLARLKEDCLVAVVRAKNLEQGEKVVDAIIAGGINFIHGRGQYRSVYCSYGKEI